MLDFSCIQHAPSKAAEPSRLGDKLLSVVTPSEPVKPGSKASRRAGSCFVAFLRVGWHWVLVGAHKKARFSAEGTFVIPGSPVGWGSFHSPPEHKA